MKGLIFISLFLLITNYSFSQNYKVIIGGTVIKTNREGVIENATVLLEDNIIIKVGKANKVKYPKSSEVIDATGKYLIPGLVDAHIHFFQSGGLYTRPDGLDLRHRVPYEEELKWIKDNIDDVFKRYIRCGVTTVVDMGGPMWNFEVRDYSKTAEIAPRVFLSGPLIASYQPSALECDDLPIIKVFSKEEALELVKKQIELNTDFIKIWYVHTRVKGVGVTDVKEFLPIVEAIIEESHKHNKPVFVHCYELEETVKPALRAGADVLVHSVRYEEVDDEFIQLCKKNNVKYIPTLCVFNSYESVYGKKYKLLKEEHLMGNPKVIGSFFDMYELSEDELDSRHKEAQQNRTPLEPSPVILKNLKKVQDAGITVVNGTDAGNVGVIHGPAIFREFMLMSKAGLTNHEILVAATLNGAKLFGNEDKLGSIEVGKLADIVILNSNPLEDIRNTSDISLVIKDGKVFDPAKVIQNTPEDLAQIQLNAYNNKDIESFLAVYSPDIEVYRFPDSLMFKGREAMRERYTKYFDKAGDLHCELVNRITYGKYVLDREKITTEIPGRETFEGQAIYEVYDGYIQKVWFMK